jgi:hypothetical protein
VMVQCGEEEFGDGKVMLSTVGSRNSVEKKCIKKHWKGEEKRCHAMVQKVLD